MNLNNQFVCTFRDIERWPSFLLKYIWIIESTVVRRQFLTLVFIYMH